MVTDDKDWLVLLRNPDKPVSNRLTHLFSHVSASSLGCVVCWSVEPLEPDDQTQTNSQTRKEVPHGSQVLVLIQPLLLLGTFQG